MTASYVPGRLVGDKHGQNTILQALIEVSFKGVVEPERSLELSWKESKRNSSFKSDTGMVFLM